MRQLQLPPKRGNRLTDVGQKITTHLLDQTQSFARIEGTGAYRRRKDFCSQHYLRYRQKLREQGIDWKQVDVIGCKVPQQIKRYARLGLSTSDGETMSMCGTTAKQGKMMLLSKAVSGYVEKKIIKFAQRNRPLQARVICVGDEFEIEEDLKQVL